MHAIFFLVGIKTLRDESGGRILLGDNRGNRAIILQLIRPQYVAVWISTGIRCINIYG